MPEGDDPTPDRHGGRLRVCNAEEDRGRVTVIMHEYPGV